MKRKINRAKKFSLCLLLIMTLVINIIPIKPINAKAAFDSNRIYLDTRGMNLNASADWTTRGSNLYMFVETWGALQKAAGTQTIDGITYVYWDASGWGNTDHDFGFLYEDSWTNANSKYYYRTSLAGTTVTKAKGTYFRYDGTYSVINSQRVYNIMGDVSKGDSSVYYPVTTEKITLANTYYAYANFYDYYSNYELTTGLNRKTITTPVKLGNYDEVNSIYKQQGSILNKAISNYFIQANSSISPLYFGDFLPFKHTEGLSDSAIGEKFGLINFNYYRNNKENDASAAYQGLVSSTLGENNTLLMSDGTIAPYFNANFLRGHNVYSSNLGKVYEGVDFPFTLNSDGYWEFDSSKAEYAVRLTGTADGGYYLNRTGTAIQGRNASNVSTNGFFPFNDPGESNNLYKLNYMFGMHMDIPFTLTDDGTIKDSNGDTKDIVFSFSGDDDVWIFIDGKLVLDMGGDHGIVNGTLNFNKQEATVSNVKDSSRNGLGSKTINFSSILPKSEYTKPHTMTIYYMERGLWESNMKIVFNFPKYDTLTIEKQVEIPYVNPLFQDAISYLDSTNFDFDIKNLATSGSPFNMEDSDARTIAYNDFDAPDASTTISNSHGNVITSIINQSEQNVLSWYCSGEKSAKDGQAVTDNRLVKILPAGKPGYISITEAKEYLSFQVYNTSSVSGTDPFIALVDADGTRIGGWISGIAYRGNNNTIGSRIWKTMKVDIATLEKCLLNTGTIPGFDYSKVTEVQFGYWDDVTIYVDNIEFRKEATITDIGFSRDQATIPDYGSIVSKTLMPADGAAYNLVNSRTRSDGNRQVMDGTISLINGDSASFRDTFRNGSYIYINEKGVDPNVFNTSWTLLEDNKVISSSDLSKTTANVSQARGVTSVTNVSGTTVDDGRIQLNPLPGITVPEKAIVFRKYTFPDDTLSNINLKAVYTNTLRTCSITISKELKEGSASDGGREYKFRVEFQNIAGMGLESKLTDSDIYTEFTLKAGASTTIDGIPAGTNYKIYEISDASGESILASVVGSGTHSDVEVNLEEASVSASTREGGESYTFTNLMKETVNIAGIKTWVDLDNPVRPDSITVQLQRKQAGADDSSYEVAKSINGSVISDLVVTKDNNWEYSFKGLPKYVDDLAEKKVEYVYRVVEIKIGEETVVDNFAANYEVSYDGYNITNTYVKPKGDITIVKKDGLDLDKRLEGAEFRLDRLDKDNNIVPDTDFKPRTVATDENGIAYFGDLEQGKYQVTEIKAPEGYSLLKEPIIVEITEPNLHKNITVLNHLTPKLPHTGAGGNLIYKVMGLAFMATAIFYYFYQRNKRLIIFKEGEQ